ncbi:MULTISPECIES: hypothetical protein [Zhongshania]|jgi:hypothetical protein|uniref:Uncharacterized protein n=1 Tax=Zhongshania antarctica TaxID=641702 RepID=A0A840R279_9GAMM|nr:MULTISPECIES: hypothetical protein [Zhongshania]MBB5186580.1 hypothetical protein [Zhongshania antarctica]
MINSKDDAMTPSSNNDLFNTHIALLLGTMAILMLFMPEIR